MNAKSPLHAKNISSGTLTLWGTRCAFVFRCPLSVWTWQCALVEQIPTLHLSGLVTFSVCDIQQRNVFSCSSFHYSFSDIPSSCLWSGVLVDILRLRCASRFSWSAPRGLSKQRGLHGITKKRQEVQIAHLIITWPAAEVSSGEVAGVLPSPLKTRQESSCAF